MFYGLGQLLILMDDWLVCIAWLVFTLDFNRGVGVSVYGLADGAT
jgi:hypothetical protein